MKSKMLFAALVLFLALAQTAAAQTIRGTVEDSSGVPLNDVRVSVIGATSDSVIREARSGNAGEFAVTVPRAGRYRVRLNRIGFAQITSLAMDVKPSELITLRFTMHVVARQLAPVTVVERRNVSMLELMSATGFDMRQSKYPMFAMSADQLAEEKSLSLDVLFRNGRFLGLEVTSDTLGEYLTLRTPPPSLGRCTPEVFFDGIMLNDGPPQMSVNALTILSSYTTDMLYGVEVYRGTQTPPPSLGGLFGTTMLVGTGQKPCGSVAVWTKTGRERSMMLARAKAEGAVQVIRGTVIDFDTGEPVPNAALLLRSEYGAELEKPVNADSTGTFTVHTKQFQKLRLDAVAGGYVQLMTPAFSVDIDEMLTVQVILSKRHQPIAPIALVSRELSRNYPATDFRGFSYRRRRALGGTFFDDSEIARSRAVTLADLLKGVTNVSVTGGPDSVGISFAVPPAPKSIATTRCRPMYFMNGELQRDPEATVRQVAISQMRAVEVFPLASEVPYVYRMGSTGCGVVGIWTK